MHLASSLLGCPHVDRDGSFSELLKVSSSHHFKQIKPGKAEPLSSPETACLDVMPQQSTPEGFLYLMLFARSPRAGSREAVSCPGSDRPGTSPCAQSRSVVLGLNHKFLAGLAGLFSAVPSAPFPAFPLTPAPQLPGDSRAAPAPQLRRGPWAPVTSWSSGPGLPRLSTLKWGQELPARDRMGKWG